MAYGELQAANDALDRIKKKEAELARLSQLTEVAADRRAELIDSRQHAKLSGNEGRVQELDEEIRLQERQLESLREQLKGL